MNYEEAVISAVIMADKPEMQYLELINSLSENDFVDQKALLAFKQLKSNYANHLSISATSLVSDEKMSKIFADIALLPVETNKLSDYIEIVQKASFKRRLQLSLANNAGKLKNGAELDNILDDLNKVINSRTTSMSSLTDMHDSMDETLKKLNERIKNPKAQLGLNTGFKTIDDLTLGLHDGELTIIAARPSVGKTALALNLAVGATRTATKPILYFSFEMPKESIDLRLLAMMTGINLHNLQLGKLNADDQKKIVIMNDFIKRNKLFIDDTSAQTLEDLKAKVMAVVRKFGGVSLVVIDYLGLIQSRNSSSDNRAEEVAKNARGLKVLSMTAKTPIIALAQLNRGVEQREDKHPRLSDLRDSGEIEQSADVVGMLYRDDYYDDTDQDISPVEYSIKKNRQGKLATINLNFQKGIQFFSES